MNIERNQGRKRQGRGFQSSGSSKQQGHQRGSEQKKATAAEIDRYLKGISFPASKEDVVSQAEENNAPSKVLHALEQLDETDYNSITDVSKQLGGAHQGRSRRGSRGPSPAIVEHYLKGIDFPANTDEIMAQAERNNAPSEIIELLEEFGDHDYYSAIDISREMSMISSRSEEREQSSGGREEKRQSSTSRSFGRRQEEEEYYGEE